MSALPFRNPLLWLQGLWIRFFSPSSIALEERITKLEAEVAQLKSTEVNQSIPWWEEITGSFEDDPLFDEAMALGEAYRHSAEQFSDSI